jgi:hypothetical protein
MLIVVWGVKQSEKIRAEEEAKMTAAFAQAALRLKDEDIRTKNLELGLKDQEIRKLKKGYEKE